MRVNMRLACVAVAGLALAAAVTTAGGSAGSFPCRWSYNLYDGLRPGYVTAGENANCAGRAGALTLSARLLSWNPKTRRWRTDKAQTRTWRNIDGNRFVELLEPCRAETIRATFSWILRDSGGGLVARNAVTTARLAVPGPNCRLHLR